MKNPSLALWTSLALLLSAPAVATAQSRSLAPLPPRDLTVQVVRPSGSLRLAWVNDQPGVGHRIERRKLGQPFVPVASVPVGRVTYNDRSFESNADHEYRVRAVGPDGVLSTPSNTAQGRFDNSVPVLATDVVPYTNAATTETTVFEVQITDAEGDPVSLTLLNPPPGLRLAPVRAAAVPHVSRVCWEVSKASAGLQHLVFEATDVRGRRGRSRLTVSFRVDGILFRNMLQQGDVTGDGVLDVVIGASRADVDGHPDTGAVYVWEGGKNGASAPSATLAVPGFAERLGYANTQSIQLADVTDDGILDVVVHAPLTPPSGAIFVWAGGALLEGSPAPTATLDAPASAGTLGGASNGSYMAWQIVDVTGDGALDILAANSGAGEGKIWLWAGGPGLVGDINNTARLRTPGLISRSAQGLFAADVSGDGIIDVVALAPDADVGVVEAAGVVYVFLGGPHLSGLTNADAVLEPQAPRDNDKLGFEFFERGVRFADLNDDGIVDIAAAAPDADRGMKADVGTVAVWYGDTNLSGTRTPDVRLWPPTSEPFDSLSSGGFRLMDVTADGVDDVVVGAHRDDGSGVEDAGALYVWAGGPGFAGAPAPTATLRDPAAAEDDELGAFNLRLEDVTGDGLPDVIAGAPGADIAGAANTGVIHVWSGGPTLLGTTAPLASLTVTTGLEQAQIGSDQFLADVTGDGQIDVVSEIGWQSRTGMGGILVFEGGPSLTGLLPPLATLVLPGTDSFYTKATGLIFADVTGDDIPDVVAGSAGANRPARDSGAIFIWQGGAGLVGSPAHSAVLRDPDSRVDDQIGRLTGEGIFVADVTGDGAPDVVAGSSFSDKNQTDNGAAYLWDGADIQDLGPSSAMDVSAVLAREMPYANDELGKISFGQGQGLQLADVTGDGRVDVIVIGTRVNVDGVADVGGAFLWTLQSFQALTHPTRPFTVPGASASDLLGD